MSTSIDILFPPLSAAGVRPLDFGVLVPGAPTATVTPNTARSGEFWIKGTKNHKSVDISFTLPTALVGPGGATIPLTFNGNYAAICEIDTTGTCVTASYFVWNPVSLPLFHDTPQRYSPGRKTYTYDDYGLYIGGGATPSATQRAGHYTASVGALLVVN